jgi:hypothetical protein
MGMWPWFIKKPQQQMTHPGKLSFIRRPSDRMRQDPTTGEWLEPRFTITTPGKILEATGLAALYGEDAASLVAEWATKLLMPPSFSHLTLHITNNPKEIKEIYDWDVSEHLTGKCDCVEEDHTSSCYASMHSCMQDTPGPLAYGKPGNLALAYIISSRFKGELVARCIIKRADLEVIDERTPVAGVAYMTPRVYTLGTSENEYADGAGLSRVDRAAIDHFLSHHNITVESAALKGGVLRRHEVSEDKISMPYLDGTYDCLNYNDVYDDDPVIRIVDSSDIECHNTSGTYKMQPPREYCDSCGNNVAQDDYDYDHGMCYSCWESRFSACRSCGNEEEKGFDEEAPDSWVYVNGYGWVCSKCHEKGREEGIFIHPIDAPKNLYHVSALSRGRSGGFYRWHYSPLGSNVVEDTGYIVLTNYLNAKYSPSGALYRKLYECYYLLGTRLLERTPVCPQTVEETRAIIEAYAAANGEEAANA